MILEMHFPITWVAEAGRLHLVITESVGTRKGQGRQPQQAESGGRPGTAFWRLPKNRREGGTLTLKDKGNKDRRFAT